LFWSGKKVNADLLERLGKREIGRAQLFAAAEADFNLIPSLLEGTTSEKAAVRNGCGSALADLCAKHPEKLYPFFDRFLELLGSESRILTWNALAAIANLTAADADGEFDANFGRYYSFLGSEYMVTVANVVAYSARIAKNKPYLADRIAQELLKVENLKTTPHLTEECKLVIAGHAIKTFSQIYPQLNNKKQVLAFAQKHVNSSRASLRKEAKVFLKKWRCLVGPR
jgi:hypothetical protein